MEIAAAPDLRNGMFLKLIGTQTDMKVITSTSWEPF